MSSFQETRVPLLSDNIPSMKSQILLPKLMDQNIKSPVQGPVSVSKVNSSSSGHQDQKFICAICGKTLSRKTVLTRHIKFHSGEKPFSCNTCGKAFFQKSSLTTHIKIHLGEKSFRCNICERTFVQKSDLRRHSMIHSKPTMVPNYNKSDRVKRKKLAKQHSCELCNEVFSLKRDFSKHKKTHKP